MMCKERERCTSESTLPEEVKFASKFKDILQVNNKLFMERQMFQVKNSYFFCENTKQAEMHII